MSETNYILLDTSYFIFIDIALIGWWKLAQPDIELGNPIKNEIFVEKFKKTFVEKLKEIPKRLKLNNINYLQVQIVLEKIYGETLYLINIKKIEHTMIPLWVVHSLNLEKIFSKN